MDAAKLALTTFFITLIPTRILSRLYLSNTDITFFNKYATDIITVLTFIAIFALLHLIFKKTHINKILPENFKGEALLAVSSYFVLMPGVVRILTSIFGGGTGAYTVYGFTQVFAIIGFVVLVIALIRFLIALEPSKNKEQSKS